MKTAWNADVGIAYQSSGPASGFPLLLLPGAAGQMVMWPRGFRAALVDRGCQVVRIDNRDTGLSTHLSRYDVPRRRRPPAYTLRDMTDDVIAVFDALGWSGGHVLGLSLGGILAQATATYHPERVRGLVSMASTPSVSPLVNRQKLLPNFRAWRAMRRKARNGDEEGCKCVELFRAIGSPGYPLDERHWRDVGRRQYERGLNPRGDVRILRAVLAAGDRRCELGSVRCPALIIHGEADPMCLVRAGRATAAAIPGARFVSYPGMGHDLPRELWPAIVDEIMAHLHRSPCGY
ncbi:alpha/beta fold hydrolase [Sciscionella sediminilitoris]|uniref:alpha/beta fold hydrolase n=1 Tax=Sciscionella sediminilitoris TaxID=1445613 RepID=UPI0004DF500C|nr:alpha/beta hydrolase [Sciscionella sp. SE31]